MTHEKSNRAGLRVAEYGGAGSGIAAAYAGWLLAQMGAQVTRFGASAHPHTGADAARASPVQLALDVLTEGKDELSSASSGAEIESLLRGCDILLCDARPAFESAVAPLKSLAARFPQLVTGCASAFGLDGPLSSLAGSGLDAQALSAMAWALGEPARAPLTLPPGIVEHQAGAMLAAGCLLALNVRDAGGSASSVDIALADVLAVYVAGNCRFYVHHGLHWQRSGRRASGSGGAYPFMILPCKDGAVCVCGRTREEWTRLVNAMGNPAWAAEPRYQELRAMGTQYPDEVDALVAPWFARHTKAELEAIALANNLIVSPLRDMAEVLGTAHFTERGFFRSGHTGGQAGGPAGGQTGEQRVMVPGLPFRVLEQRHQSAANIASALLCGAAPPATAPAAEPATPRDALAAHNPAQPLTGLRVLDFGWVWSAPWVSTILGELGAQVIKVEHAKRPDNLRLSGRVMRDGRVVEGPSKEMSPMYHQVNHGKLGITLNTKEPRAVALLKRLAATCDLVVENMSPGSMERSNLGYETLRAVNPRMVMLAMSSAGQFGSLASMRAYAPTMSSFVGMEALVGYPGEAPSGALNIALGDPNATVHALPAVLAALRRARLTGQGCYIDLSQNEALLGTLRAYFIDSQVRGRQPPASGNADPEMAPHGIYPARGNDAWLTLSVSTDAQWRALTAVAAGQPWSVDARFATGAGRLAQRAELDAAIARWSASFARDELTAKLRAAGIAATPVLSLEEQRQNPHFAARGLRHRIEIPVYGEDHVYSAPWRFSGFAPQVTACGPATGQHNDFVFGEILGLPAHEIAALKAGGVIA